MNVIQLSNHDLAQLIELIRYAQLTGVTPRYWIRLETDIVGQVHQQRTGFAQCALCTECDHEYEPLITENGR